jgi:hypothetical protein
MNIRLWIPLHCAHSALGLVFAKLRLPLSYVAQTDCLPPSQFWGIDDATQQNLQSLKGTALNLLNSPVSKRNFATGRLQAVTNGGKNKEALQR